MLFRAVRVEEFAAYIHYFLAVPDHRKPRFGFDFRNDFRLQILLCGELQKLFGVLRIDDDRHTFLRLADRKFGTVQPVVLARNGVEVDFEPVRELAYSHAHAARSEVVTPLYEPARLGVAEKPLKFSLFGRVALLNFRAARLDRAYGMRLRRAGRAAATVSAGAAAEQNNDVARRGNFAPHVLFGRSRDHRADFHTFRRVTVVINFVHNPCCKPYLIAVRRVPRRRAGNDFALRKLTLDRLRNGNGGICRARNAHRAVNVSAPRKRIADRTAYTGSRTAERFDFGRVIVRFVLEQQ